jgi:CheY-like chemotaxis protein
MNLVNVNVLVIDDNVETLETIKLYLSDVMDVTVAASGKQGLHYVQQKHFDVILLDIEMPTMDGFMTLEQLRNLEDSINIPVIMLTGKRDKMSVTNSIAMGVDGYLVKPVSKEALIDKVTEVCEKRKQNLGRRTLLAIDDDMSYLKQVNSFLQDYYNVIMINSTKLALEYLTNHVPDIILLDHQMPLYNGVAVLSIIRQNEKCKDIPVIVLSGCLDKEALLDFYPYKPAAILAKPTSKETLLENISEALSAADRRYFES